ncbi:hypothetical protein R7V75_00115 [Mesomycoplasma ovipneumoniae]|uniref:Integrase catalytic domain-containing protein n=1 Tax=Mesomycoplasma ovipneumoniae TaxID=29562 RepID=A0ABU4GTK5_9BACT|nr:hypothetical protein [Mesomycoplasma ovipneumoniae]MDW2860781.1 hypothetical protein [Mesomycoplasma ovipneumoniae]MDW2891735.1 hypothetical protein [Mesomycoplasma ovipneumoniae]MDW2908130.1 hypothetical protein [Mesomycoplasma ovipneumoniae]
MYKFLENQSTNKFILSKNNHHKLTNDFLYYFVATINIEDQNFTNVPIAYQKISWFIDWYNNSKL